MLFFQNHNSAQDEWNACRPCKTSQPQVRKMHKKRSNFQCPMMDHTQAGGARSRSPGHRSWNTSSGTSGSNKGDKQQPHLTWNEKSSNTARKKKRAREARHSLKRRTRLRRMHGQKFLVRQSRKPGSHSIHEVEAAKALVCTNK